MNKLAYKILVYLIIINSFVSITNTFYPSSLPIGRVLGALLLLNLAVIYLETLRKQDLFFIIFLITSLGLAIINSTDMALTIENSMFFLSTSLIIWKLSSSNFQARISEALYNCRKLIYYYIIIGIIIMVIGMIIPSCYKYVNGDNLYYGFADSGHKLAGNICFITALTIFILKDNKFKISHFSYFGVLFFILLMTGSRTYCVSEIILIFVYYKINISKLKLKSILVPIIGIGVLYLLINSNVLERFFAMGNNQYISSNFWEASSSGRLIWWKIDIEAFLNLSFFEQLVGKGFAYVYDINQQFYGLRISAHNDFITLLLSIGLIGIVGYLFILFKLIYNLIKNRISKSLVLAVIIYVFWNACISGFYGAQQYVFGLITLISIIYSNRSIIDKSIK